MRDNKMRGRASQPRRARRGILLPIAVLVVGAALVAALGWSGMKAYKYTVSMPCFTVTGVQVTGLKHVRLGDLVSYVGDPRGMSVFEVDIAEMQKRLRTHPWVKAASVKRELPGGVRIEVMERTPVAVAETGSGRFLIDDEGLALAKVVTAEWDFLPVIGYPRAQGLRLVDDRTADELKRAVELLGLVRGDTTETLAGSQVLIDDDGQPFLRLEGALVKVGRGGYADKVRRLTEVAVDMHKRDARPALIDLRFPGKVVVKGSLAPKEG